MGESDGGLLVQVKEIRIFAEDTEDVKKWKREDNREAMKNTHERGALELPIGIPENCKVEQPRDQIRPDYDGKQGNLAWRAGGDVRICYINGINRKEYKMGFAGRARTSGEMNSGEGVGDKGIGFY